MMSTVVGGAALKILLIDVDDCAAGEVEVSALPDHEALLDLKQPTTQPPNTADGVALAESVCDDHGYHVLAPQRACPTRIGRYQSSHQLQRAKTAQH